MLKGRKITQRDRDRLEEQANRTYSSARMKYTHGRNRGKRG